MLGMGRPQLLLVPFLTELEWATRPELEEWAEVASFDAPGVGKEPPAPSFGREAIVQRAAAELDRRGWERFVIVADGFAAVSAVGLAASRPDAVAGLALGHARLSNAMDGERAPINRAVVEAFGQLARSDWKSFVQHGIAQVTHGSFGDELAGRMVERVPPEVGLAAWDMVLDEPESYEAAIAGLDAPLLFARHADCLVSTREGFEDAVAAFPQARTMTIPTAAAVSPEFAQALRSFCDDL